MSKEVPKRSLNFSVPIFQVFRSDYRWYEWKLDPSLLQWALINIDRDRMDHPFHLHINRFQVVSRNGQPDSYRAWKDTVLLRGGETVRIRIPFRDFAGKTVYHCHILDHEDLGMMGRLNILEA